VLDIAVDHDCCMGSGMCTVYAPGTFTQDDQAKVVVIESSTDPLESIRIAVEACPTGALELLESNDVR
jgi:ferredoxin